MTTAETPERKTIFKAVCLPSSIYSHEVPAFILQISGVVASLNSWYHGCLLDRDRTGSSRTSPGAGGVAGWLAGCTCAALPAANGLRPRRPHLGT